MDIKFDYNITSDEFLEMVESVGWKTYSKKQIDNALANTMYMVKATVDGKLAGIGRVVGDSSIVCMLTDICVKPEFQKHGIGLKIVKELKRLISSNVYEGEKMQIELTPTAGNESFYQKNKYIILQHNSGRRIYQIFSFKRITTDYEHMKVNVNDENFVDHLNHLQDQSIYTTDVTFNKDSNLLVLQTCTNDEDNSYYILSAIEI